MLYYNVFGPFFLYGYDVYTPNTKWISPLFIFSRLTLLHIAWASRYFLHIRGFLPPFPSISPILLLETLIYTRM